MVRPKVRDTCRESDRLIKAQTKTDGQNDRKVERQLLRGRTYTEID